MVGAGTDLVRGGHAGDSWKAGTGLSPLVLEPKVCLDTKEPLDSENKQSTR